MRLLAFFVFLSLFSFARAEEQHAVHVDLHSPYYEDGVLTTNKGGVLKAKNIRIQAKNIQYIRKTVEGKPVLEVAASDDLMVEWGKRIFTGKRLTFDFVDNSGVIYEGRTQQGSWFLGGRKILLKSNGSYKIRDIYVTTCESSQGEWAIRARNAKVKDKDLLSAKNITIRFFRFPIFWFPIFKIKLSNLKAIPTEYIAKAGGGQGTFMSIRQEIYSRRDWKTFLQLDYWLKHGPGGSIQTDYNASNHPTDFRTNNFLTWDLRNKSTFKGLRDRFTGELNSKFYKDTITLDAQYEKLSDPNVLETYFNRDYFLQTERHTHVELRIRENSWISTLRGNIRINPFQTVAQQLPGFAFHIKPISINNNPLIFDGSLELAYLSHVFGSVIKHTKDLRSTRYEIKPNLYCPINLKAVTVTPRAGFIGILYGNNPNNQTVGQAIADLSVEANLFLSRRLSDNYKHGCQPYGTYRYLSNPTTFNQNHFIFDMDDAYALVNEIRYGVRNQLYYKKNGQIYHPLFLDFYGYTFLNDSAIGFHTPKLYLHLGSSLDFLYSDVSLAWNIQHNLLDHVNVRTDWTISSNLALGFLFMHRGIYDYRKADKENFILDLYRAQSVLSTSSLSDQRDIVLTRLYWQFLHDFILKFESRTGWHRKYEPGFNELRADLTIFLTCNWRIKLSFTHTKQVPIRFKASAQLGGRPKKEKPERFIFW